MGGLGEFRLRLLGHQSGILANPCLRLSDGLGTVLLIGALSGRRTFFRKVRHGIGFFGGGSGVWLG